MNGSITNIFNTLTGEVLYPVFQGILTIVAVVAGIAFVVFVVQGFVTGRASDAWWKAALVCLGCLLVGFAPDIINWLFTIAGNTDVTFDPSTAAQ